MLESIQEYRDDTRDSRSTMVLFVFMSTIYFTGRGLEKGKQIVSYVEMRYYGKAGLVTECHWLYRSRVFFCHPSRASIVSG